MGEGVHFIGAGDLGNEVAIELSRIHENLGDDLFNEEHDDPQNHLHVHSFSLTEARFDGKNHFIILAGSVHDPCWEEARKTLHESRPYLMVTIGIEHYQGIDPDTFQPFPDECLVFPDASLFEAIEVAQLVLQIIFIHTPWNVCRMGSLIGYDLADTKRIFAGKATQVKKMTSDKEHYPRIFSKFLSENKADLSRAEGILTSFWGRDDVLSIPKANELIEEMRRFVRPEVNLAFTFHVLPEDEPNFMSTMLMAL